jgi:hypothetical protein
LATKPGGWRICSITALPSVRKAAEAARAAADAGGSRVLEGYSVSSLPSALTFANEWAGRAFSAELRTLYPGAYSYDWAGLHFFGRPVTVDELNARLVDGKRVRVVGFGLVAVRLVGLVPRRGGGTPRLLAP